MLCVCAAVMVAELPADFSVTVATRQAALMVQDTHFAPAVQLLNELQVGLGFRAGVHPVAGFRADAGVGVGHVGASRMQRGYRYRGLVTRSLWIASGWVFENGFGFMAQGRANLAAYELTSVIFSYVEVELAPRLTLSVGRHAKLEWSVPFVYQFRHDVDFAMGVGVRGALVLEFSPPRP